MAQVYKAWHTELHRYEALKLLRDSMTHEATIVARFLSEARTAAKLQHPNIATIYSVGDGNGSQPYFTMELIEGRDLGEHLRRHGPLTLDDATPLLQQIAEAIDYAHSLGVIHRDIKPANILLGDLPSGGYTVKLVDFGIARVQAEEAAARLTQTGGIVGTPKYISPEQASEQPVDYRADIYSFGVVAYEMLCGRTPFEGPEPATTMALLMAHVYSEPPTPRDLAPSLSQTTSDALLRSLAKSPEARFSACGEFVRVLTAPRAAEPPTTTSPNIVTAPKAAAVESNATRTAARSPRTIWPLVGAAVFGALTLATVFAVTRLSPTAARIGGGAKPAAITRQNAVLTTPIPASDPKQLTALSEKPATPAPLPATQTPLTPLVNHPETAVPAPILPAPRAATHPAATAAHATATAAKPAVNVTKHSPLPMTAHALPHDRHPRSLTLRRRPRLVKARITGRLTNHRNLAAAWDASYHQEMALANSFRAKGDVVQANAMAQNAEDSRRHAFSAAKPRKRRAR